MLKALINKILGGKIGLWLKFASPKDSDLRTEVDEDADMVELYLYGYNIFISPGGQRIL